MVSKRNIWIDCSGVLIRVFFFQMKKFVRDLQKKGHKMLVICRGHLKTAKEFQSAFKGQLFYYVKNR